MTKAFLLFAGEVYYPRPGWMDFRGEFDSVTEAAGYVEERADTADFFDWWQVVDIRSGKIVAGGGNAYSGPVVPSENGSERPTS